MDPQESEPHIGFARESARKILQDSGCIEAPTSLSAVIQELSKYDLLSVKGKDFDTLDGVNIRSSDEINIIYNINNGLHRNRFTIAHELGHFVLGHLSKSYDSQDFESSKKEEVEANAFAGELLIPTTVLKKLYKENPDLKKLALRFLVSDTALYKKVMSCGLLKASKRYSIWLGLA